jgi:hypothetical protein
MSKFKNSILRELGIRKSSLPPSTVKEDAFPGIDPLEQDGNMQEPTPRDRMMSPTAVSTPVLAIAVRGSNTGGLPSGRNLEPSKLGGYEPIPTAKENSLVVDKTPESGVISNPEPVAPEGAIPNTPGEEHPHQVQNTPDQPPQAITGASTEDDSSLQLKAAMPQGIDVDVAEGEDEDNNANNPEFQEKDADQWRKDRSASPEGDEVRKHLGINEGKHKAGCTCGFCKNKNRFGKKSKDDENKDDKKDKKESDEEMNEGKRVSTTQLFAVRQSLQEKAIAGTMSKKESEVFSCITEVLQKRGKGVEKRLFGKKSMLETAGVVSERELPHEEVLAAWEDDKSSGDYIGVNDKGDAYYQGKLIVPSEREKQMVPTGKAGVPPEWKRGASTMNPDWKGIKAWCNQNNFWPNVWVGNDHGNVELYTVNGKPLGGLV